MTGKSPRAAIVLSMIALVAWAIVLQVEWESKLNGEWHAVYLPYAESIHPLSVSDPAAAALSSRIFPGLYEIDRQGALIPRLASSAPAIDHRLEVTSRIPVQLPDGTKLNAVNASNYIAQILRLKKEEALKSIKIVQVSPDCVRFSFDPAVAGSEERLVETLGIKRDDRRLDVKTIFTIGVDLRRDLQWDPGHPFTSEDVLFTYNLLRAMGPQSPFNYRLAFVDEIVAVGKERIVIRCKAPSRLALELCAVGVLPKFAYEGGKNGVNVLPPVSTQPYLFLDGQVVGRGNTKGVKLVFGRFSRDGSRYGADAERTIAVCLNLRSPKFYGAGRRKRLANAALNQPIFQRNLTDCDFEVVVDAENGGESRCAIRAVERWRKAGARVALRKAPHADYLRRLKTRNFEAIVRTIPVISSTDLYPLFHSTQSSEGANIFGYTQADRDKEILALDHIISPDERKSAEASMKSAIMEDVPLIDLGPEPDEAPLFSIDALFPRKEP